MATATVRQSRRGSELPLSFFREFLPEHKPVTQELTTKPAVVEMPLPATTPVATEPIIPADMVTYDEAREKLHQLRVARDARLGAFSEELTRYEGVIAWLSTTTKITAIGRELVEYDGLFRSYVADIKGKSERKNGLVSLKKMTFLLDAAYEIERAYYKLQAEEILPKRARLLQFGYGDLSDEQRVEIVPQFKAAVSALKEFMAVAKTGTLGDISKAYLNAEETMKIFARSMPWVYDLK